MHDFYKERGLEVPKPAVPQPVPSSKGRSKKVLESVFRIPPELDMSLLLEFIGANEGTGHFKPLEKKFVRVSGEATIGHVEKFLRRKMGLDPACQVDIICGDHLLEQYQTLREIRRAIGDAAMQNWKDVKWAGRSHYTNHRNVQHASNFTIEQRELKGVSSLQKNLNVFKGGRILH
uniref:Polycomb group ring finger 6 n=2 Tax=Canis lupus familiaris TaxID=9615 RepID=A0A8I3Q058_CANLF